MKSLLDKVRKIPIGLPGYRYCGNETDLINNLRNNVRPINNLDRHCLAHDLAYQYNPTAKHAADSILAKDAFKRIFASDSNWKERAAAGIVSSVITAKKLLGFGLLNNKMVYRRRRSQKKKRGGKKRAGRNLNAMSLYSAGNGLYLKPFLREQGRGLVVKKRRKRRTKRRR